MNFNFSKEFIIQYFVTNLFILAACCACYLIYDFCALVAEPKRLEKEMAARKRAKEMQIQESMPSAADVRPVKWIPVTERLPEYGRPVLLYFNRNNHNSMGVGDYYHDGDTLIWRGCGFIPTHWMPMPEPPKEREI